MWIDTGLVLAENHPDVPRLLPGCRFRNPEYTFFARKGRAATAKYLKLREWLDYAERFELDGEKYIRFPRGFADRYYGITVPGGPFPKVITTEHRGFPLRPGQTRAVEQFVRSVSHSPSGCGVFKGACGSGKTIVGCEILRRIGLKALVLVDKDILIDQWVAAFEEYLGLREGEYFIRDGKKTPPPESLIDIYTVQTIMPHNTPMPEKVRQRYGQILIDECHIVPANVVSKTISTFPARYCFGTTATAVRKDGLGDLIFAFCGPIRAEIESPRVTPTIRVIQVPQYLPDERSIMRGLTGAGPLGQCGAEEVVERVRKAVGAHPDRRRIGNSIYKFWQARHRLPGFDVELSTHVEQLMFACDFVGKKFKDPRTGDVVIVDGVWDFLYKLPARNKAILQHMIRAYFDGRHIMGLSHRKWYCSFLKDILAKVGIRSEIITGETKHKDRRALIKAFKAEEFRVLLATIQLVEKGLDVPILDAGFLFGPSRVISVDEGGNLEQAVGRFQRPKANPLDPAALIYEVLDGGNPPNIMVQKHLRYYRKQGYPIEFFRDGRWVREGSAA